MLTGTERYHAGLSAEEAVERHYARRGHVIAARRWRGQGGEIDLVARGPGGVIFIEVKKSRSFARAAEALRPRQVARLFAAASEFLCGEPAGQGTDCRFDVALVDATGRIEIIENALMA